MGITCGLPIGPSTAVLLGRSIFRAGKLSMYILGLYFCLASQFCEHISVARKSISVSLIYFL